MNITVVPGGKHAKLRAAADCIFRIILVFSTLLGVLLEINECLMPEPEAMYRVTVITSLAVSVFGVFFFRNLKTALAGAGCAGIAWLMLFLVWKIRFSEVLAGGLSTFWSRFMETISDMGYMTLQTFQAGSYHGSGRAVIITFGVILGMLFSATLRRRVCVFPYMAGILIIVIPFLVFSIPSSVAIFLFLAVAVTSVMCAAICDRQGGDALSVSSTGVFAMIITGLISVVPATATEKNQGSIPLISDVVEYVRDEMTAFFSGEGSASSQAERLIKQGRSANPEARRYTGRRIMTVSSEYDVTLYLSEWVGAYYVDDSWYAEVGDGYTLESDTAFPQGFFDVCRWQVHDDDFMREMGLVDEAVVGISSYLAGYNVWLPFQTYDISLSPGVKAGFPARSVMQTSSRLRRKTYSVEAWLQIDNSAGRLRKIDEYTNMISSLEITMPGYFADGYLQDDVPESIKEMAYEIIRMFGERYGTEDIPSFSSVYIPPNSSDPSVGYAERVGRYAELISEYLSDRCEYTLTPSPKEDPEQDAMDHFLYTSRQGYCVQFATAAALAMRYMGFPTRYVEGYVANSFKKTASGYSCNVLDRNAHAWIEVWLPYYGWRQFEVTPAVGTTPVSVQTETDAPSPDTTEDRPAVTTADTTGPVTFNTDVPATVRPVAPVTTDVNTEEPEITEDGSAVRVVLPLFAAAAVVALLVFRFRSKVKNADDFLSKAIKTDKDPGRREKDILVMHLRRSLSAYGLLPGKQLPSEYKKLLYAGTAKIYPDTDAAVEAMEGLIYGDGPDAAGERTLARLCVALRRGARASLGKFRFFLERYLLCRI